jgi:hypothetical protein
MDYELLRKLAVNATPGPWVVDDGYGAQILSQNGEMCIYDEGGHNMADARFIAAANPATIINLLDEIARLKDQPAPERQP